jgi:hypothetical protein
VLLELRRGAGGPDNDQQTLWNSRGFYADENQTVNVVFNSNEWNNTGICVSAGDGGSGNAGASSSATRRS